MRAWHGVMRLSLFLLSSFCFWGKRCCHIWQYDGTCRFSRLTCGGISSRNLFSSCATCEARLISFEMYVRRLASTSGLFILMKHFVPQGTSQTAWLLQLRRETMVTWRASSIYRRSCLFAPGEHAYTNHASMNIFRSVGDPILFEAFVIWIIHAYQQCLFAE